MTSQNLNWQLSSTFMIYLYLQLDIKARATSRGTVDNKIEYYFLCCDFRGGDKFLINNTIIFAQKLSNCTVLHLM